MNKLIDELEKSYNHTNQWLKFAESKNGALIALDSALLIGILTLYRSFSAIKFLDYYSLLVLSILAVANISLSLKEILKRIILVLMLFYIKG
jgi:hypothetical protein